MLYHAIGSTRCPAFGALMLGLSWMGACTGVIDGAGEPVGPSGDGRGAAPGRGSVASGPGGEPATSTSPGGDVGGGKPPLPGAELAARTGLRRLTVDEYNNTLRDLLGDDTRPGRSLLPDDSRTPFDNDYTNQVASKALVEGVELLASDAAARLIKDAARRDRVVGCKPASTTTATSLSDDACLRKFVASFGRRALRRPLGEDEIARFVALRAVAARAGDFYVAVQAVVEAFLQHPELLYRVEIGKPVPGQAGLAALGPYEIAARLSYLLWGGPPDDNMLDRAAAGGLASSEGVRAAAAALLVDRADPRARARVARFHALWLDYDELKHEPALAAALQAESAALVARVVFEERRPWQDLFRLDETFISDTLAKHYGLPPTGSAQPRWVKYGASGRRGLLSHGGFLSIGGKPDGDASPTKRGLFIRERLFCTEVPQPEEAVDFDAVNKAAANGSLCKVDRYALHSRGGCAGCHRLMDPVGFGLDNYDGAGRYRNVQYWTKNAQGNPVLATSTTAGAERCEINGSGEIVDVGTFKGPAELADLVLRSGRLGSCLTEHLHKFTVGRSTLDAADHKLIEALRARIGDRDFRFDELLLDLVSSPAFAHRREEL